MNPFETRRREDPQAVIDDLLKQTTRQGVAIAELNTLLDGLLTLEEVRSILPVLKASNLASMEELIAKLSKLEMNLTPPKKEKKKKEKKEKETAVDE